MKRLMSLCLAAMLLLGLTGTAGLAQGDTLRVVATNFPAYDFTRAVAGDRAEVSLLLPPGAESHSFEPRPQDILNIQEADLFVYTGGPGDAWVDQILASMAEPPATVRMMDLVTQLPEEVVEGMEDHDHDEHAGHDDEEAGHDDEEAAHGEDGHGHEEAAHEEADHDHEEHGHEGHVHAVMDEHVWTSPENARRIAQGIMTSLVLLDPAHAADYALRMTAYGSELDALDKAFREVVEGGRRKTFVFGDRFPLRYFAAAYGLDYYAAFPGCATQTEPSAKTVTFLVDKVRAEGIPVVFHIEFSNEKAAQVIAQEAGAKALLFHSTHNVSRQEMEEGATYLSLMRDNVEALREALN